MKFLSLTGLLIFISFSLIAQENTNPTTETVLRINIINPGFELELPTGSTSTFSTELGIGYGGGYPDLTYAGSGFIYIIAPFIDLQYKKYYNFSKRTRKGKTTNNNSGNFISLRFLSRGKSVAENVIRTTDTDFSIGPTWGI